MAFPGKTQIAGWKKAAVIFGHTVVRFEYWLIGTAQLDECYFGL
jgi:hypothetical protein